MLGLGQAILDGESERPLGISIDWRLAPREGLAEDCPEDLGTSRMLRLRPVVGSRVKGVEGSCETLVPSMMYYKWYVSDDKVIGEQKIIHSTNISPRV